MRATILLTYAIWSEGHLNEMGLKLRELGPKPAENVEIGVDSVQKQG